jgi:ribosome maturation factor RimP
MVSSVEHDLPEWAAPLLAELGLDLYDVELAGGVLRVVVTKSGGVGLDEIAKLTRGLGPILDERDPIRGHFTLEVSSPGLERKLRTVAHRRAAVGESVKVKLRAGAADVRRIEGTLDAVTDDDLTVGTVDGPVTVAHRDVDSARTVFVWPVPAQAGPSAHRPSASRANRPPNPKKATT